MSSLSFLRKGAWKVSFLGIYVYSTFIFGGQFGYRILGRKSFSFRILEAMLYCPQSSGLRMVVDKSDAILIPTHLYMCFFSLEV